jgi:hypothetical protein
MNPEERKGSEHIEKNKTNNTEKNPRNMNPRYTPVEGLIIVIVNGLNETL